MLKRLCILFLCLPIIGFTQEKKLPKLVVGIVVDQMRNDYIHRYWNRFGENGIKKLVKGGFYCENTHFNYVPTYTGPGHASIYTGSTPKYHGVIANDWFDRTVGKKVYCVSDNEVNSIGVIGKSGKKSPIHLKATNLADELKLSSVGKSKVFSIALKDRSAILPAGHMADGAFWMSDTLGHFCTSSFYAQKLPKWLQDYNSSSSLKDYLKSGWNTLYPINTYSNSISDNNNYESSISEKDNCFFPYDFENNIKAKNYGIIKSTPFGNSVTTDLALKCIEAEQLGKDDFTDLLMISYSSPDLIGHVYGPRSVEMEDNYLRFDIEIERLLNFLEKQIGADNFLIFLTADHGGADIPNHLKDSKVPAGLLDDEVVFKIIRSYLKENKYDENLVLKVINNQVYLDNTKIDIVQKQIIELKITDCLKGINGIADAYTSKMLLNVASKDFNPLTLIANGYNTKFSGNVAYRMEPGWLDYYEKGTTHGSCYPYDTHVPLIFYGNPIKKGSLNKRVEITQIAPTISQLLKISFPNTCFYEPIVELFKD
jgi:predicted AlkP superfamily pyrophosphatase or phosphodiesterase